MPLRSARGCVREFFDAIAQYTHPFRFARLMWQGDVTALVDLDKSIDAASVAKLYANIEERNLGRSSWSFSWLSGQTS